MGVWLARRVAASAAIVLAVATITFLLLHLAPGEAFLPGADAASLQELCKLALAAVQNNAGPFAGCPQAPGPDSVPVNGNGMLKVA